MANKKNTNTEPVNQVKKEEEKERKYNKRTRLFLIIFASIALLGIIASVLLALNKELGIFNKNKPLDYMKANLSKYISIDPAVYESFDVVVELGAPDDFDVENYIIGVLCENKSKDPVSDFKKGVTLSAGDVVGIYYRGYTLDENGKKNYFDGGCNFNTGIYDLELGSGSFVPGFEYNLIGKNQNDYATLEESKVRLDGDEIICLTYSSLSTSGVAKKAQTAIIDLSDPELDSVWGGGFAEFFKTKNIMIGNEIGDKLSPTSGNIIAYEDMTVTKAFKVDDSTHPVLEVEAYFPYGYQDESLSNKTAYFEVYMGLAKDYEVPTLDDEFITETLKLTAEELSAFEGDSLVEKYKNMIREELNEEYEENVKAIIDTEFWEFIVEKAEFKQLPEKEVDDYYNSFVYTMQTEYYNGGYSNYYTSFDSFALQYMGVSSSDKTWQTILEEQSILSIKQKLAFYYVIRECEYVPNDEQYEQIYNELYAEILDEYLEYYDIDPTDEDYETKRAEAIATIDANYSEDYWQTNVVYEYGIRKIREHANVTYK